MHLGDRLVLQGLEKNFLGPGLGTVKWRAGSKFGVQGRQRHPSIFLTDEGLRPDSQEALVAGQRTAQNSFGQAMLTQNFSGPARDSHRLRVHGSSRFSFKDRAFHPCAGKQE